MALPGVMKAFQPGRHGVSIVSSLAPLKQNQTEWATLPGYLSNFAYYSFPSAVFRQTGSSIEDPSDRTDSKLTMHVEVISTFWLVFSS